MYPIPVKARTEGELRRMSRPGAVQGQSEATPWVIYDTATYVDNTTTSLTFFTDTRANPQLSNLSPAGSLPSDQYFEVWAFYADILAAPGTTAWSDVSAILRGDGSTGAPIFRFELSDKQYGPQPLDALGGLGGITGFGNNTTVDTAFYYGNNGIPGASGWFTDGAILIPPQQRFQARIDWAAAVDISADTLIRVSMAGVLHRSIR